jgi:hypothetical protein
MRVNGVASDGSAEGMWGIAGDKLYEAKAIKVQGSQLKVVTTIDSVAALTRPGDDVLTGSFTRKSGDVFSATLTRAAPSAESVQGVPRSTPTEVDDKIIVIYVSAADCPYCARWDRAAGYQWEKSALRKKVEYVEVHGGSYMSLAPNLWPKQLQWVQEKLRIKSGTPRFIVIKGQKVVMHQFGIYSWSDHVLPLIERLVAEKESHATQ